MEDHFIKGIEFCSTLNPMKIIEETILYDFDKQIILANFNNYAHFHNFPIKLILVSDTNSKSPAISYSKYEIFANNFKISGISYINNQKYEHIQVNLKSPNIYNSFGSFLINQVFRVKIKSFESQNNLSQIIDFSYKIAEFLQANK